MIVSALIVLADTMIWRGEFDEGERWLQRAERAVQTDDGPGIRFRLHLMFGMLHIGRGHHPEALEEFEAAKRFESQLVSALALASRVTGWLLATQARLGMTGEARAALAALDDERAISGEIANARAVICLAEGDPDGALAALWDVVDGTAPVIGYHTVVEAHLLAGLAYRELGDQHAANQAAERALALAEADRLVLPFTMTGSPELLEALRQHRTAHGALLADILDVMRGASLMAEDPSVPAAAEQLSAGELRILRYLPTNLSRPEIAAELSVSVNTVSTHLRQTRCRRPLCGGPACPRTATARSRPQLVIRHGRATLTARTLALAEADRLVQPLVMIGSRELLKRLPRHRSAHAVLLAGAAVSPDEPVQARDRGRTVRFGEHRQFACPQYLRQAPGQ